MNGSEFLRRRSRTVGELGDVDRLVRVDTAAALRQVERADLAAVDGGVSNAVEKDFVSSCAAMMRKVSPPARVNSGTV